MGSIVRGNNNNRYKLMSKIGGEGKGVGVGEGVNVEYVERSE